MSAATLSQLLEEARARLAAAGIEEPRREARLMLGHVLGEMPQRLLLEGDRAPAPECAAAFRALLARRCAREPMSHLLGYREFWSLRFRVGPAVLDPRPDSETLVQAVLDRIADRTAQLRVLDLGCGSGCLLLALLHELPAASGLGIDCSDEALAVARENADSLRLAGRAAFARGNWTRSVSGRFDVVISNPPYIPTAEIAGLMPEVAQYEPKGALDGGADGLAAFRAIAAEVAPVLMPHGFVALEIGQGQGEDVKAIFTAAGFSWVAAARDLGGIERVLIFVSAADFRVAKQADAAR